MAKKYILKDINHAATVKQDSGHRAFERNLLNISALGIKWNSSLIKQIRSDSVYDNQTDSFGAFNSSTPFEDEFMQRHASISGHNDFIAFYDQTYQMRRDFLRKFALQGEIDYILETIADEVIVNDDAHYFAYPNTRALKSILKPEHGKHIVDEVNSAYRRVYHMFNFHESNDAWHYVKKFLVDGFLAFEIIYSTDNTNKARDIIGFKELDAIRLQPEIKIGPDGVEHKVWVLNKGDKQNERELLDTNVIYISWAKNNFITHLSYCERLIRSFNMLRTIENSRVIWNIQNAQKRVKIVVPVGTESLQKQKTRIRELQAMYREDISIDNMSGEITVNGQPKFPFAKTFIFPAKEGTSTDISELGFEGHDMNSTESLKWFWQRFIIESRLPKDRFNMFFDGQESSAVPDNTNLTKEEYRFSLFIGRIRDIIKELLIKPTWLQFCLHNSEFADNIFLKSSLGLTFVEENVFALAKEAANIQTGSGIVTTLSGIMKPDGTPVFNIKFLTQKYLMLTDDDWKLNEKLNAEDAKEQAKQQAGGAPQNMGGGGLDMGGGFDMGGGAEPGGAMEMGGAPEEPPAAPEGGTEPPPSPEPPAE